MNLAVLDSAEIRLVLQIMSFSVAIIVARMAVIEWRRNRNAMFKYLTLGFGILFLQITVMGLSFIYAFWQGQPAARSAIPFVEHTLMTAGYIYLAAAFTTVKSSFRSRFIRTNFLALFIYAPLAKLLTMVFPGGVSLMWAETGFDVWNAGLLILTILVILNSNVRLKKGLVISTSLLVLKHVAAFANAVILMRPSIGLQLFLDSAAMFYFCGIIITLHKEIIADVMHFDRERNMVKEKAHQDTIRALINSLEAKDEYTRGHSDRVTEYAVVLGELMGLEETELTRLYYGAILHDIGKIGISEGILNHPSKLGSDDFDCIKKHPEIGATIVSSIESLKNIAPSILYHHERYDGSGYPEGLAGRQIPLHARIIAIGDALDAMSTTRTYRDSMTMEKAIRELVAGAGTQFDPHLVKLFVRALGLDVKDFDPNKKIRTA